jgi:histidine triad (HIT) family protein
MTTDPNCIFCKIVAGAIPSMKLAEDAETLAFMDINPFSEGHCLVIAKGHYPDLYAVPDATLGAVAAQVRRVASAVRDALAPAGLNIVQANGPAAGQSVLHYHMHILPRAMNDGATLNWGYKPGDRDRIAALAERIRSKL